jgi:N-acetylglutamate synthase-like GNAT family acetyltransferase
VIKPTTRRARAGDAPAIAALLGTLGYLTTADRIPERLTGLEAERSAIAFVAELDGKVVGLATVHVFAAIHVDHATAYLTALAVDENHRREGIGTILVLVAMAWAREQGAQRLSLVTGIERHESQRFYESLGFALTGYRYSRRIEL